MSTASVAAGLALALAFGPGAPRSDTKAFSEAWLEARAEALSRERYDPRTGSLPKELADLSYDQLHDIRFRPDASLWRASGSRFELQFFHLGQIYRQPVDVFVVERGRAQLVDYSPELFDYGANRFKEPMPKGLGFAGFRAHFPLNTADYKDEVIAFLGASYFRALGKGNAYGLSARGLAIDTALPGGEEFPLFREFYVERPARGARRLVVHALLDSRTTAGAYRFEITPGESTEVRVTATLYPRKRAERLGLAPLTSMFLFGENGGSRFDDYRPSVHDSDGLLLWLGNGERVWRPLQNPERLEVSAFRAESLKGFGLLQRDRDPGSYSDAETQFQRRPSAWVEPLEGFGAGTVFLIEIPSREDTNDNMVAFFTPDRPLAPGTPLRFAYRLLWGMAPEPPVAAAAAVATHVGSARQPGVPDAGQLPASARRFIVDFVPPEPPASADGIEAVVTVSSGTVANARVEAYQAIRGYRAMFDFVPAPGKAAELRCFLRRGQALSETWTYWVPPPKENRP